MRSHPAKVTQQEGEARTSIVLEPVNLEPVHLVSGCFSRSMHMFVGETGVLVERVMKGTIPATQAMLTLGLPMTNCTTSSPLQPCLSSTSSFSGTCLAYIGSYYSGN
jgi:hypothetical protein